MERREPSFQLLQCFLAARHSEHEPLLLEDFGQLLVFLVDGCLVSSYDLNEFVRDRTLRPFRYSVVHGSLGFLLDLFEASVEFNALLSDPVLELQALCLVSVVLFVLMLFKLGGPSMQRSNQLDEIVADYVVMADDKE